MRDDLFEYDFNDLPDYGGGIKLPELEEEEREALEEMGFSELNFD